MKTTVLASALLLGFAAAGASLPANANTIDAIDVTELSFDFPEQTETAPILHTVKKRGGGHRGGNRGGHRGGRDRNNLASDGNIGNGTLLSRRGYDKRYSNRKFGNGNGPFTFLKSIFGN